MHSEAGISCRKENKTVSRHVRVRKLDRSAEVPRMRVDRRGSANPDQ
jgi:hypothetical protein